MGAWEGDYFTVEENEASTLRRLEPVGALGLNLFQLFILQLRNLRPRECKRLPQHCMVTQCQNPDADLAPKSYYRDNFNKAGDLQHIVQRKHSGNMNFSFSFLPHISWLLTMTYHSPIPHPPSMDAGT